MGGKFFGKTLPRAPLGVHSDAMVWRTLKSLNGVRVGQIYDAMDKRDTWYRAEVVDIDDDTDERRIKVTYAGWARKHDEWITDARRVRNPRPEDDLATEYASKKYKGKTHGLVIRLWFLSFLLPGFEPGNTQVCQ